MLTFYDRYKRDTKIIKESKPLRDKFKFVMTKIIEKWFNTSRRQQKDWDIEKHKSFNANQYAEKFNDIILELVTKLAGFSVWIMKLT